MVRLKVAGDNQMIPFSNYEATEATPEQVLSSTTLVGSVWNSPDTKALSRTTLKLVNGSLKGFRVFREAVNVAAAGSQWPGGRIYSITFRKIGDTA
jgi:hypothetical protein